MPLPEKRDHAITLPDAVELARQHRKDHPNQPKAHFFFRDAFDRLLAQPGAAGIRIYRGKGKDGAFNLVMVAVDGQGADMTASSAAIMEQCVPCPPFCPPNSPLQA